MNATETHQKLFTLFSLKKSPFVRVWVLTDDTDFRGSNQAVKMFIPTYKFMEF